RKVAERNLAGVERGYEVLAGLPFPKPGQDLLLSRQLATLATTLPQADARLALSLARRASAVAEWKSEDRFDAVYQSAALAIAVGDMTAAEEKLRTAIQQAPTWYKPRVLLTQLLLLSGRKEEAGRQRETAVRLAGR